jgi:hypothetical protein
MELPPTPNFDYIIYNGTEVVAKALDLHQFFHAMKINAFECKYGQVAAVVFPRGFRAVPDWTMAATYGECVYEDAAEIYLEGRAVTVAEHELSIREFPN